MTKHKVPVRIGVLGPHNCSDDEAQRGREIGAGIAKAGAILVCGGLGGMMQAAAEGARSAGGTTVGILPGEDAAEANRFIEIPLPTGLGALRNAVLVRMCDAVIAIHGGYGTLSEIGFALRLKVPVVGLGTWSVCRNGQPDPGIHAASTPAEAVKKAIELAGLRKG
ncbi:MAG: TIGR00725 family protein [Kiritimatiellae bacterium]|nr:TIGR00725 family protein [Kiritimatiellia bacterium]